MNVKSFVNTSGKQKLKSMKGERKRRNYVPVFFSFGEQAGGGLLSVRFFLFSSVSLRCNYIEYSKKGAMPSLWHTIAFSLDFSQACGDGSSG
jgi:hypothetical protein